MGVYMFTSPGDVKSVYNNTIGTIPWFSNYIPFFSLCRWYHWNYPLVIHWLKGHYRFKGPWRKFWLLNNWSMKSSVRYVGYVISWEYSAQGSTALFFQLIASSFCKVHSYFIPEKYHLSTMLFLSISRLW